MTEVSCITHILISLWQLVLQTLLVLLATLACCNGKTPRCDASHLIEIHTSGQSHAMLRLYATQLFAVMVSGVRWWRGGLGSIWPRPTRGCTWWRASSQHSQIWTKLSRPSGLLMTVYSSLMATQSASVSMFTLNSHVYAVSQAASVKVVNEVAHRMRWSGLSVALHALDSAQHLA